MTSTAAPGQRLMRAARRLAAPAMLGILVLTGAAVVPAQAITGSGRAQAIPVNWPDWSKRANFGSRGPAWYTDSSGLVHLQGAVRQVSTTKGANPDLIGILPKAARPDRIVVTIVHTFDGTFAVLAIEVDGKIFTSDPPAPAAGNLSFVSLEGITLRPAGDSNPIGINRINWTGNVTAFRRAAWFTDTSGVVHLQGAVSQTSANGAGASLIGTLPRRARPIRTVYTVVATTGGYADLSIEPNGNIGIIDPRSPATKEYQFVSLESISFRPALSHRQIKVNKVNWAGGAGFNARAPGWFADRSGVIHLQGAVRQVSNFGAAANLIGTLPPAARPSHTVYTIVHTFNGTYADLAIKPDGDLSLINPAVPLITDFSFVSLESITYRR